MHICRIDDKKSFGAFILSELNDANHKRLLIETFERIV